MMPIFPLISNLMSGYWVVDMMGVFLGVSGDVKDDGIKDKKL
jgi:hypothetical protein